MNKNGPTKVELVFVIAELTNLRTNNAEIIKSNQPFNHKDNLTRSEAYWLEVAEELKELGQILNKQDDDPG